MNQLTGTQLLVAVSWQELANDGEAVYYTLGTPLSGGRSISKIKKTQKKELHKCVIHM